MIPKLPPAEGPGGIHSITRSSSSAPTSSPPARTSLSVGSSISFLLDRLHRPLRDRLEALRRFPRWNELGRGEKLSLIFGVPGLILAVAGIVIALSSPGNGALATQGQIDLSRGHVAPSVAPQPILHPIVCQTINTKTPHCRAFVK
jgi:hypothetical protein